MISKKVLGAAAGVGALLVTARRRQRVAAVPTAAQRALRRRRYGLPQGVQEFPPALVDRRYSTSQREHVAAGDTATEVAAEYYQEHPTRT